jgi:prepilin-type processing-associated H-X9-DG protein
LATSVLAGDRNITNDYAGSASTLQLGANYGLRWTHELHEFKGNLLFADGHVEEKSTPGLKAAENQVPPVAVLAVPTDTPLGMGPAETGSRVNGSALIPPAVLGIGQNAAGSAGGNAAPAAAPGQPAAMVAMSSSGRGSSSMAGAAVAPSDQPVTELKRPPTPTNSAATGPTRTASDEDQQPTFFGQWVASLMEGLVRKGLWWLYALLVLMIGATLVARRWARGKRVKPVKMSPPED